MVYAYHIKCAFLQLCSVNLHSKAVTNLQTIGIQQLTSSAATAE